MSKRKRSESFEDDDDDTSPISKSASPPPPRQSLRTVRAESKLQTGIANVYKALGTAAGIERQKLGGRRKKAKGDLKLKERLEAEYAAAKTLRLRDVAEIHLCKTLSKIKSVSTNPARPSLLVNGPPKSLGTDVATLNVAARLYKAGPVKKAVSDAIEDIVKSLGAVEKSSGQAATGQGNPQALDGEDQWSGISDSEDGSDNEQQYRALIASYEDISENSPHHNTTRAAPTKSAFMPTLTMGGYWSGSESDAEDLQEDLAPKKNRRGQRARQHLAEKKFGQQAKHLQKKPKDERNQGWDSKKGAQLDGDDRSRNRGSKFLAKNNKRYRPAISTGANSAPLNTTKPKTRDDTGRVHPSWEAAKKAKEQAQTAQFAGKKITFD